AASLAALSWAGADDAKPAMESTTGSVRRYAFVCFMVLLLGAFPSGMREGRRAPCKYPTPRIRCPAACAANLAPPRRVMTRVASIDRVAFDLRKPGRTCRISTFRPPGQTV